MEHVVCVGMAAVVFVTAPDADSARAALSPFSVSKSGLTTLSSSGTSWGTRPELHGELVITAAAAAFQPMLEASSQHATELIADARVSVQLGGRALPGRVVDIIEMPAVASAAQRLLSTRTVGGGGDFRWSLTPSEAPSADVSLLILVACRLPDQQERAAGARQALSSQPLQQGASLCAVGSPFGVTAPQHFDNMLYSGIVSHVIQDTAGQAQLLLADFRVLPGMEGGPVLDSSGALAGIVATPLLVGGYELPSVVPVAIMSAAISQSLAKAPSISRQPASNSMASAHSCSVLLPPPGRQRWRHHAQQAQQWQQDAAQVSLEPCSPAALLAPVVAASAAPSHACQDVLHDATLGVVACSLSNGQWASGVLVSGSGVVLTNAHLFDKPGPKASSGQNVRVRAAMHTDTGCHWRDATVLRIFTGALDIAVVQMLQPPSDLRPLALSPDMPSCGDACFVAGHALFNPVSGLPPLLTHGNVARVLQLPLQGGQQPAMLLTTAAVHSGASGGAVLNETGELLGMVTSNARHASGRTLPHLNFSIASDLLRPLWQHLQQPQDVDSLEAYDTADEQLTKLWMLQPFLEQDRIVCRL